MFIMLSNKSFYEQDIYNTQHICVVYSNWKCFHVYGLVVLLYLLQLQVHQAEPGENQSLSKV